MSRVTLEPMHSGEIRTQVFDFSSQCAVGETLSVATVAAAVYSGTDPAPFVTTGSPSISGQKVTILLYGGGLSGVVYVLTVTVATSLSQNLKLIAYLSFIPATQ